MCTCPYVYCMVVRVCMYILGRRGKNQDVAVDISLCVGVCAYMQMLVCVCVYPHVACVSICRFHVHV